MSLRHFLTPTPQKPRRGRPLPPQQARLVSFHWLLALILTANASLSALGAEALHAGFLYDEFNLTLAPGNRTEAAGPFFYSEHKETQRIWAVPPLLRSEERRVG